VDAPGCFQSDRRVPLAVAILRDPAARGDLGLAALLLARHPVQYELPAGLATDLPALQEAGDAPLVERVTVRVSNVMDGATADDVPPVVALQ